MSTDPFGFVSHVIDLTPPQTPNHVVVNPFDSSRTSLPKNLIPINPFEAKSNLFTTPSTTTTEALPKIIVPNLPIQQLNSVTAVTQSTANSLKSTPKTNLSLTKQQSGTSTTESAADEEGVHQGHKHPYNEDEEEENPPISRLPGELLNENNNRTEVYGSNSQHSNEPKQNRTPSSSFIKSSQEPGLLNTESTNQQPPLSDQTEVSQRNPALIRRSMLNGTQNTALSIFLTISTILSIGILCLTLIIFLFSR